MSRLPARLFARDRRHSVLERSIAYACEPLERRVLLTDLVIPGTIGPDLISVLSADGTTITYSITFPSFPPIIFTVPDADFDRIVINTFGGDDSIVISGNGDNVTLINAGVGYDDVFLEVSGISSLVTLVAILDPPNPPMRTEVLELRVFDSSPVQNFRIFPDGVVGAGFGNVMCEAPPELLNFYALGNAANSFEIEADVSTQVLVNAGGGNDQVTVRSNAPVTVDGEAGVDSLVIDFDSYSSPIILNVTSTRIHLSTYSGVESVTLEGTQGDNRIDVVSTLSGTSYLINANGGDDTINVAQPSGDLANIRATLNVNGGSGNDSVALFDDLHGRNENFIITLNNVTGGPFFGGLVYDLMETVILNTGFGQNIINVNGTSGQGTSYFINAGGGDDTVNLANAGHFLGTIFDSLVVNGDAGINRINLYDDGTNVNVDYTITASTIDRTGPFGFLSYSNIRFIDLSATQGQNNFFIDSLAATSFLNLFGNAGFDILRFGEVGGSLDDVAGPVVFDPGTDGALVAIHDEGTTANAQVVFAHIGFARSAPTASGLQYSGAIEYVEYFGGSGHDTIDANGIAPRLVLFGGGGDDVFNINAANSQPIADGEAGADQFNVNAPTAVDLRGGSEADVFRFNVLPLGTPAGAEIDGGGPSSGAGDRMELNGTVANGSLPTIYQVSGGATGAGTLQIWDGTQYRSLAFTSLENPNGAVFVHDFANFMMQSAFGIDRWFVDGVPALGQNIVSGTTGESTSAPIAPPLVIASMAFKNVTQMRLNTGVGSPGRADDTITIQNGGIVATGLSSLAIQMNEGNDMLNVNAGTLTYNADASPDTQNLAINVNGTGSVVFNATQHLAALNIGAGAQAAFSTNGNRVLVTKALNLAGSGRLGLSDNAMIVDYTGASPVSAIAGSLATGYNGGTWTGNGIRSSSAAMTPNRAVGYAEATDLFTTFPASFVGQSIDNTAVLLRYTLYGDATLNRTVDIGDFASLAANFNTPSRWSRGNFNFDVLTDIGDFSQLAANFNQFLPASVPRSAGVFGGTRIGEEVL